MTHTDSPIVFGCQGDWLLGVLTRPARPLDTAVVVIVGGPQYRAGSHRQFTLLAWRLAGQGWPVLRFDYRGMGDSTGAERGFEDVAADISAAVDAAFVALPGLRRVVLWGLCDGASAALLSQTERADARVAGLCLLNPWVRSEVGLARTHVRHYYLRRLTERDFWHKLMRGGVAGKAALDLLRNMTRAFGLTKGSPAASSASDDYRKQMARAWHRFAGPILLVLSGDDYTAKEFVDVANSDPAWRGLLQSAGVQRCNLSSADHTFSESGQRLATETALLAWLDRNFCRTRVPERLEVGTTS